MGPGVATQKNSLVLSFTINSGVFYRRT
ncbi:hypothetical protein L336_0235 [Candidatus Saccharimonas aalborgensis]|uniref:Uncharacterized protein n=1 Tax=Candidatus Saccharimonas aalborgensis TaxID=1332188 RepID=R4PM49_9BACT|nr:hypothetical protein L336_0235 [Candidatus Saccharimonas aalborgensis]